jgi:hypothetical protein
VAWHLDPTFRVHVQARTDLEERGLGMIDTGLAKRRSHVSTSLRVPNPVEMPIRIPARQRGRLGDPHAERGREPETAEAEREPLATRDGGPRPELREQGPHRWPPSIRIVAEPALERASDPPRHAMHLGGQGAAHVVDHRRGQRHRIGAAKRMLLIDRLEERDAEAELIRGFRDLTARVLLRSHVRGRPGSTRGADRILERLDHASRRARPGVARLRGRVVGMLAAREAEVGDHHATVGRDEHVVRLEVAMHEPFGVRRCEPASGVREHVEDLFQRAWSIAQPRAERHAVDELHRDEHLATERAHVVHRHDVGVGELGHRLGLAQQAARSRGRHHVAVRVALEHLERDTAIELWIVGRVHDPHAARAHAIEQHIAAERGSAIELHRSVSARRATIVADQCIGATQLHIVVLRGSRTANVQPIVQHVAADARRQRSWSRGCYATARRNGWPYPNVVLHRRFVPDDRLSHAHAIRCAAHVLALAQSR